jgi:hypothetical protein
MWRHVDLVWTDVSEERIAFFIVTAVKTTNLTNSDLLLSFPSILTFPHFQRIYCLSLCFDLGRGHTKENGNRSATAISENCYQPELNTWYWMEQRKLRKLATATQPQFPRIVISLSWTRVTVWSSANWGNLQPQRNRNFRELLSAWVEYMLVNGAAQIEETALQFLQFVLLHSVTCVQLRLIIILGNCGCVAVASFFGVPSP